MPNNDVTIGLYSKQFHNQTRRGVAVYSHGLVHGLARVLSETKVYLFDCFWPRENFKYLPKIANTNFKTKVLRCPGRIFDRFNKSIGWPRLERLNSALDLMHFMQEEFPVSRAKNTVITVHGIGPFLYPQMFTKEFRDNWRVNLDRGLEGATRVICVSNSVKKQLKHFRPQFLEKYDTTFLGVSEEYLLEGDSVEDKRIINAHGIDYPYILYVGAADLGKNLINLLEAFALFSHETKPTPPQHLVLVGNKNWGEYEQFIQKVEKLGISERVHLTGYVDHLQLPAFYRGCDLFVFPPLFEGFGLPLLEAMACGAPCLASSRPALDEVGGDVAEYFDPESVDDMSNKLRILLSDSSKMESMRVRGPEYARKFTWERTARKTIQVYEDILGCSLT